ncbi:MAG: glycosyltransferase family 4 protein [Acidobacteriota bacterium]
MRILIATDAFPPACGGSGWSTYELARGLRLRGHAITIVMPRPGLRADHVRTFDELRVEEIACPSLPVPFVRTYAKNEWLWPRLAARIDRTGAVSRADIVHAQHQLTSPAAVIAARRVGIPVVCTVRDYWPVCYWGTTIVDPRWTRLCPECTSGTMMRCLKPRAGAAWLVALGAIPYMRANLARKQRAIAEADAIVAVSQVLAGDLRRRARGLRRSKIVVIPNPVDVDGIRQRAMSLPRPVPGPYALFVGKLEPNKGSAFLLPAMQRAALAYPLVVVGDGAERGRLERQAFASGRPVTFTGWLPRDEVLQWLAHASVLVFPSYGPESLSRVLLEAATLGVPVAAMHTGGTAEIVQDMVTGLLVDTAEQLGDAVARLAADEALALRLGAGAQAHVERTFASAHVAAKAEALYEELVYKRRRHA